MVNFDVRTYGVVEIFGLELWITETIVNTWIIMAALIVLSIICRVAFFKKQAEIPSGFQNLIEALIELFDNFILSMTKEKYRFLGSWFFTIILFVGVSNISGMFTLRPPTADVAMTLALALSSFMLIHGLSVRADFKAYVKSFFQPVFVFFPINLISAVATPVALAFRLFGNVMAGTVIMGLMYNLMPWFVNLIWPGVLHAYFDLFAGLLHAYIFTVLSLSFIMDKLNVE